jgi:hypothetical protein
MLAGSTLSSNAGFHVNPQPAAATSQQSQNTRGDALKRHFHG